MSQTSIGRAALVLTTNGSGMRTGLDQEGRYAEKWAGDTGKRINAKLKDTAKPAAGGAGMLGGLAAAGPVVAGVTAAVASAAVVFQQAADTLQDLGRQGEMAAGLGISAQQFTGLSGVFQRFGLDAQGTADVLTDVADWVQDAAVNGGELAETFGFLGLNARELNALKPDQQFLAIADAFQKIDPTLAAGLAARLGGDFQKLLPVLRQGGGAIQNMASGFAVSAKDMESARVANQALTEAGSALGAAWRAVAVALSPVITLIGKGVSAAVGLARPALQAYAAYTQWLFGIASKVWNGIADVAGRVWDRIMQRAQPVFDWLNRAWAAVQEVAEWAWEGLLSIVVPVVEQIVSWVEQAVDAVADWAGELLGFTSQWPSFRDVVIQVFRALGTAGAYAWDTLKAGAGGVLVALGFMVEKGLSPLTRAFRDLVSVSASLPDELRPAWVDKLNAALVNADGTVAGLGQRMQQTGKGWINSFGDSATQFNSWLDKMAGRQKQNAADVKQAQDNVAKGAAAMLAGPALIKGSSAEVSARLKYETNAAQNEQKRIVEEQKKGNGLLGGILGAAQRLVDRPGGVELAPM